MQKKSNYELGFLPTKAIEGKIRLKQCIIAEVVDRGGEAVDRETLIVDRGEQAVDREMLIVDRGEQAVDRETLIVDRGDEELFSRSTINGQRSTNATPRSTINGQRSTKAGYLIAQDRYFKRDEVGCITQISVMPEYRRSLVAAQLLQYQFDHSSYGCKLYSCWCAQDLKANEFWEAMGFIPIAFRSGARNKVKGKKGKDATRTHIFWQRRIRPGDESTPFWYPSQTGGGEMREDRIVFPIMPGVSWRDVMPVVLPEDCTVERVKAIEDQKMEGGTDGTPPVRSKPEPITRDTGGVPTVAPRRESITRGTGGVPTVAPRRESITRGTGGVPTVAPRVKQQPVKLPARLTGGMWFMGEKQEFLAKNKPVKKKPGQDAVTTGKQEKAVKEKVAIDPRLLQASRDLRDRWLEETGALEQSRRRALSNMKHDVARVENNLTLMEGQQKELLKLVG